MRLFFLLCCLGSILDSVTLDFPGTISCREDRLQIWLPEEFGNSTSWQVEVLDASGEGIEDCDYDVDYEKQTLTALYMNCTNLEHNKHHLRFLLRFNNTVTKGAENVTYHIDCAAAVQADEASRRGRFTSATNCTKNFMAVAFPRLIPSFDDEHVSAASRMEWIVSIDDGTRTHKLSLRQAIQQGYTFLTDGNRIIFQVPFDAVGVAAYKQDSRVLYTVALKLTYGPPEQRLTVESRMICAPESCANSSFNLLNLCKFQLELPEAKKISELAQLNAERVRPAHGEALKAWLTPRTPPQDGSFLYPYDLPSCLEGPAICNSTHMVISIPEFPGTLSAVSLDNKNIPLNQLQANGIVADTRKGVKLYISKRVLQSRLYRDDDCSGFQSYASSLKLNFDYHGEMAMMVTYPECPCEQNAPIATVCTSDGHMDFEILSSSTKPMLNLATLQLKDSACKPLFQSPSNDVVRFRVPLNGCGTRQRFDGEKVIYENEVSALWADLPPRWISRDSEFRLTVMCSYGSDDASLDVEISSLPPPDSVVNQGPLSLILLIYPDGSYIVPYSDDQYPIVKYLRQPIFLEVQILNRVDPNIHLMLDDCWATLSLDPASLPRWDIVVDGCDYNRDNYKTLFHPVGPSVSYANFRQRFEVKAFAFVSGGKALPSLVYFHCSVLICERFHPDSPLCSRSCPPPPPPLPRNRRDAAPAENAGVVTLPHAVILVPEEQPEIRGQQKWSNGMWVTAVQVVAVTFGLVGTALAVLALLKIKKRTVLIN